MNQTNVDTILAGMERAIKEKMILSPDEWLRGARDLIILLGDEHEKYYTLLQKVAKMRMNWIEQGKSVAEAKVRTEASDEYKNMKTQESKIKQIEELSRICKKWATLTNNEMGQS